METQTEDLSLEAKIAECAKSGDSMALFPGDDERLVRFVHSLQPNNALGVVPAVYLIPMRGGHIDGLPENYIQLPKKEWEISLYRMLEANPSMPIPPICICLKQGPMRQYIRGVFERVVMRRDRQLRQTLRRTWAYYQKWAYPNTPPRVLIQTTIFSTVLQYVSSDLSDAFTAQGCEVMLLKEAHTWHRPDRLALAVALADFKPDLVVQVDGVRQGNYPDLPRHVPFVGWAMDRLPRILNPEFAKAQSPKEIQFAMWPAMQQEMTELGWNGVCVMPGAANTSVYYPEPISGMSKLCDIAFVTNVPETSDPRGKARIEDRVAEARRAISTGFDVRLYGLGWDRYEDLKPYWHGQVKQGEDLRCVYANARIVLHVNLDTNLHQRVFEAAACGSVVLVRRLESDKSDFDLIMSEQECPRYNGDDMKKVVADLAIPSVYLNHSLLGRARVLKEHTYDARARMILDSVMAKMGRKG